MIRAIGPYQLVRRLGRGGMAEVPLAITHGASGFERHVAIKMLAPELAGEPELERALIREAMRQALRFPLAQPTQAQVLQRQDVRSSQTFF